MAVQGQWNLFGYNLPDFGWSEKTPGLSALDNPLVSQSYTNQNTPNSPFLSPIPSSSIGNNSFNIPSNTQNTQQTTQTYSQPQNRPSGGGGGDSELDQLLKIGVNLNPSQRSRLGELLGAQQQSSQVDTQRQEEERQAQLRGQIDEMYNPAFSSLSAQEDYLKNTSLPNTLTSLDTQKKDLLSDLELQRATQQRTLDQQGVDLGNNERSAYSQAVRAYQSLQQQGQARYGQGSSTGQAVGELANQEFYRNQGQMQQTYAGSFQKLQDANRNLVDMTASTIMKIERGVAEEQNKINSEFQKNLLAIGQRKGELEGARSQAKLQLLQDTIARQNQLKDQKEVELFNLEIFKKQQQATIDSQVKMLGQQNQTINTNPFYQQQQQVQQQTQQPISQARMIASLNPQDDEIDRLVNPFANFTTA